MYNKGQTVLSGKRIAESALNTWSTSCAEYVAKLFGEFSEHVESFKDPYIGCSVMGKEPDPREEERERRKTLKVRLSVLNQLIEQLEAEMAVESADAALPVLPDDAVWPLLHDRVVRTAQRRFEAGHYADSVEAALKELNSVVKALVKKATGRELDGADLMHQALSPKNPIIILDDLCTESGRNQQIGYMEIFAGAMTGIRNPKAHENLTITKERAIHHLFLASLLFNRLDERTNLK
jgi:uncharacterized protein (TIGR02391 family)